MSPLWEQTPVVVPSLVIDLLAVIRPEDERISTLETQMAALEAQGQRNSHHADRPPASAPSWVNAHIPSTPQGLPGAKPGHPGHCQAVLEPTEVIVVQPPACRCGQTAFPEARPYDPQQVIKWPDIQMMVRHVVLYAARCSRDGWVTKAPVPGLFCRLRAVVHGPAG